MKKREQGPLQVEFICPGCGKHRCKKENRPLLPKDLFHLKGFMVAGTDNLCYKDDLEALWGIRPMELFAGTEPSIIGTETWTRKGMYFFPDTAFYEFITEKDMMKNHEDPSYIPPTYLMDEVRPGEKYELVFTILSLRRLLRITGERLPAHVPMLALSAALAALWGARRLGTISAQCVVFLILLFCLLTLMQVCGKEDFLWFARCGINFC